jgi:polysaccharide export outer membrane protein
MANIIAFSLCFINNFHDFWKRTVLHQNARFVYLLQFIMTPDCLILASGKSGNIINLAFAMIMFALFATSCATSKNSYYFKTLDKDTTIKGFIAGDYQSRIRSGDNLGITITSLSPEENLKFNSAGLIVTEKGTVPAYIVHPDGTIKLYRFGDVKVTGLTRRELADKLINDLKPYLKEPIVNVTYLNHRVTVMGEVANPQVINMQEEQMSLLDAIVMSGDLRENAKRNDILVIRQNGNEKKVKHVNLEDHSIFSSPWYYVQPDDIVYVMPDTERTATEEKRRNLQTTLSLVASAASLLIIIVDRIVR